MPGERPRNPQDPEETGRARRRPVALLRVARASQHLEEYVLTTPHPVAKARKGLEWMLRHQTRRATMGYHATLTQTKRAEEIGKRHAKANSKQE